MQPGFYNSSNIRVNGFGSNRASGGRQGLVIIKAVEPEIRGSFYSYGSDDQMIYGAFAGITAPSVEDCQIIGDAEQMRASLSLNFTDDLLAKNLNRQEANLNWALERDHDLYSFGYENSITPILLHFSLADDEAVPVNISLRLDDQNLNNDDEADYHLEPRLELVIGRERDYDIKFDGEHNFEPTETTILGEFNGNIQLRLAQDVEITIGTLTGSFSDFPLPATACTSPAE